MREENLHPIASGEVGHFVMITAWVAMGSSAYSRPVCFMLDNRVVILDQAIRLGMTMLL